MKDRVALITGAGRGIGEAIASDLHSRGAKVLLLDVDGKSAEAAARRLGNGAQPVVADVRDLEQLKTVVQEIISNHGHIDICVNNAARTVNRSVWDITADEWNEVLDTNLRSVLFVSQIVGPLMRDQAYGRIINLASFAGQQGGLVAGAHYAASKAGIIVLTKIFARELAPHGVTVNAVAPAAIDGPVTQSLGSEKIEALSKAIPVGRIGRPEEVASVVAYLASNEAGFITGTTVDVNGGVFMR